MRKFYYLALVALVGIAFSSCSMLGGDKEPSYQLSDLQGLWQKNNTQEFVRFTNEPSDEAGYLLGLEWDNADWEEEEPYEDFLKEERETMGHPTDGWFKYKFETNGNLTEIHLMDNGGADIPKIYIVSKLTETELEFYEKDFKNIKFYFTKVAETK